MKKMNEIRIIDKKEGKLLYEALFKYFHDKLKVEDVTLEHQYMDQVLKQLREFISSDEDYD